MIKYALIKFLKADSGINGLVGDRITPRRLVAQSAYPAIVVSKISEYNNFSHSGSDLLNTTRIQLSILAKKDIDLENVKQAVIARAHLFRGNMDNIEVSLCYLDDDADGFDDAVMEEDEFLGNLDLIINWRKN